MLNGFGLGYIKNEIIQYLYKNGMKLFMLQGGIKKKFFRYYIDKMFIDLIEKVLWNVCVVIEISGYKEVKDLIDK